MTEYINTEPVLLPTQGRKAPEPMPYIAKAAQDLPWTESYGGKAIGRMAVADTDLEAGTLVLEEEAVVTFVRTSCVWSENREVLAF